jgi:hypothetical protein
LMKVRISVIDVVLDRLVKLLVKALGLVRHSSLAHEPG